MTPMTRRDAAAPLFVLIALSSATNPSPPSPPVCNVDPPNQCPWYNASLSFAERTQALLNELTPPEKLTVLSQGPVPRLHVVSDGFNEALHGVAWAGAGCPLAVCTSCFHAHGEGCALFAPGRATVFPCPMAMASSWNATLVNTI